MFDQHKRGEIVFWWNYYKFEFITRFWDDTLFFFIVYLIWHIDDDDDENLLSYSSAVTTWIQFYGALLRFLYNFGWFFISFDHFPIQVVRVFPKIFLNFITSFPDFPQVLPILEAKLSCRVPQDLPVFLKISSFPSFP